MGILPQSELNAADGHTAAAVAAHDIHCDAHRNGKSAE
jgi:hypothetical protein